MRAVTNKRHKSVTASTSKNSKLRLINNITMKTFNQNIYSASVKAFTENGVPEDAAKKASAVIARDDFNLPNLGRNDQDREDIAVAMKHYWNNQKGQGCEE